MSNSPPMFQKYLAAVDALKEFLPEHKELHPQESSSEYSLAGKTELIGDWQLALRNLAERLLDANFKFIMQVVVGDYAVECQILSRLVI